MFQWVNIACDVHGGNTLQLQYFGLSEIKCIQCPWFGDPNTAF